MPAILAALYGISFMSLTGQIDVEPGKQLPQSVNLHVDGDAPRDVTIRYLLFVPKDYRPSGQKWPLMLFLHGYGECSADDISRVKIHGPPKIVENRADFPFILVSPQLPPPIARDPDKPNAERRSQDVLEIVRRAWKPEELVQLLDHVLVNTNADPERVYVTGLSMGGFGTWRLAATYPDRFAAAVPICGGGEPEKLADGLRRIPIWAFHGAQDPTVPLAKSQSMVDAVKRAGGDVKLTIYPDAAHNSWEETYDNQAVYDWLLSHRRAK